ncbi:MAG: hypothetical protein RML40_07380 [Bacteroidota bacterium]|nr:hypothetical protein [Candidatus Kapabacteria bacterium]MDW8220338.1 hypothetical protein [Bacteroidota bacterium]
MKYIAWLLLGSALLLCTACYTEKNPLDGIATVGGPVALVRTFTVTNPANNTEVSTLTAAAGTALRLTVTYTTLDVPVTEVNLYRQDGTRRIKVSSVSVNVAPSANRVAQTFTYTVPAGTAANTRIFLLAGVVTAHGESFSGTGVSGAGTVIITVR